MLLEIGKNDAARGFIDPDKAKSLFASVYSSYRSLSQFTHLSAIYLMPPHKLKSVFPEEYATINSAFLNAFGAAAWMLDRAIAGALQGDVAEIYRLVALDFVEN